MLMIQFNILAIVWLASEIFFVLFLRAKRATATIRDRGSLALFWLAIILGLTAGNFIRFSGVGAIGVSQTVSLSAALLVLLSGLVLRWVAILTLGRFFTMNVAVQRGQRIVRSGVYRHIRHPAYSGLSLAFLGLSLAFQNWLSLLVILIPFVAALLYRMRVEEKALVEILGREYTDYREVTKRLIPGVY